MIFKKLPLNGPVLVEFEKIEDSRGFFGRSFCEREFIRNGLDPNVAQTNIAYSREAGTLRGLHYQVAPFSEAKLVRCIRGTVWDVVVDMRPESRTYLQHLGVELSDEKHNSFYVPEGFAHGYITLTPDVELLYHVSKPYSSAAERGVRFDDPALKIEWPTEIRIISDKDRNWPLVQNYPQPGTQPILG